MIEISLFKLLYVILTRSYFSEIRIKSLHEDIERLRDYGLCKICLEEEARVVFDPCGHLCCCDDCSKQLKACPMCRDDVQKSIKVFT